MAPPQMPPQGSPYAPQGGPAPGPYSPHAMMPPGMPPPGYPIPGPPGRRSSKGLAIGLGVGGVAVAGAIIAIVVVKGVGGDGASSREDLVKRTLTAMGDGDVEKLVKLSDPVGLYNAALDCSEREKRKQDREKDKDKDEGDADQDKDRDTDKDDASDDDDPQMQETRIRHKYEKLVDKMKGVKFELVSIAGEKDERDDRDDADADADRKRKKKRDGMKKGDQAMKGCVFKVDVQFHELIAKVRVTDRDSKEPSEQKAKLTAIDAGGSWYLMAPPKLGGGDSDSGGGGGDGDGDGDTAAEMRKALAKMESFKAKMCACTDRACAERVQKEMTDWSASMARTGKDAKPREEDMKKFAAVAMAFGECQTKAMAMDTTPKDDPPKDDPPPPEDGTSSGDGADLASLPACAEYRKQIDNARACAKYPRSTVTALRQSWGQLEKSWATARSSPGTRQQMTAACEALAESVKKAIERMCP